MSYLMSFFGGAFLCNCLPHLVAGLQGVSFPTPFAKPRGVGNSSPFMNFVWGALNLAIGLALVTSSPVELGLNPKFAALTVGALALGTYLSLHFGKVRSNEESQPRGPQ